MITTRPRLVQSVLIHHFFLRLTLVLSPKVSKVVSSFHVFHLKFLYAFFISIMWAACCNHCIFLNFKILSTLQLLPLFISICYKMKCFLLIVFQIQDSPITWQTCYTSYRHKTTSVWCMWETVPRTWRSQRAQSYSYRCHAIYLWVLWQEL